MAQPIVNPELPFVDEIPSGLQPGKMIRFQGVTHPNSDRFNINFATGPNSKPRDDTALHISVRLNQGYIARNSYRNGAWQDEQGSGKLPIGKAQSFEIIVLVDPNHYKVAVNGQHFCEFPHRIPYDEVTHLLLDGDVALTLISFEGIVLPGPETSTQSSQVNASGPGGPQFGLPQYGPPPGVYGPPPSNYGGYGPPGEEPQSDFGSFFEKAQGILAGAIATGAAEKILGGILHSNDNSQRQPQGYVHQNAQYGQYPHPPQEERGPMESLLSGLLSGGGQQQSHGPQYGGDSSSGGLGGILGSLAGSFLNRPGHNQGH
ncbi:hypothetical protein ABEB36_002594 [Hypothenemus hampei]|uniref:Galectin n=1 Tax=Hypothenemus hampei TaxID=57062 RepID=A0ABD1F6B3_HYPHA